MRALELSALPANLRKRGQGGEHWRLSSVKTGEQDLESFQVSQHVVLESACLGRTRTPYPKFAISHAEGWIAWVPHLQLVPEVEAVLWG